MKSRHILLIVFFLSIILGGIISSIYDYFIFWSIVNFTLINLAIFLFWGKRLKVTYQEENKLIVPIRVGFIILGIMLVIKYIAIY
ncbi:MAG: hypothetical protein VR72_10625 [Clostridiaceae bacterium BRH_c20a]|nr:MAG: hypothetical protein VR72_10625 [Clostridiaceae bacterium BRH_c20a]